MFKVLIFALIISSNIELNLGKDSIEDTELLLTFLIHRHGDRTPVEESILFGTDTTTLTEKTAKYGYGQLTEIGIKRGYQLGQFARNRYNELLSDSYNRSEIYIRSTDSTRAKMTALAAMSAVYPPSKDNWSSEINWTPVPYTTVPAKYDFNLAVFNCPTFLTAYYSSFLSSSSDMDQYTDTLNLWSEYIGFNITAMPVLAYTVYDVYTAQKSMGIPLTDELEAIFPEIEVIAGAAIEQAFGKNDNINLVAGVFLNEFFTVADQIIAGEDVQRVQWYSGHDINVFALMTISQITSPPRVPKYGSMFALELRKNADGNYLVVPVYLEDPSNPVASYVQINGCEGFCDLETFRDVTADYVLDEDTWRTKCGFTEDMVVDSSSIG